MARQRTDRLGQAKNAAIALLAAALFISILGTSARLTGYGTPHLVGKFILAFGLDGRSYLLNNVNTIFANVCTWHFASQSRSIKIGRSWGTADMALQFGNGCQ
jgi:hypothetical protein